MATNPQRMSMKLPFEPWPPGDPGPEIWQIIQELDKSVKLRVAQAVLETHMAQAQAQMDGLAKIQKTIARAKRG